ncbi:MAG: fibrillarin-like rRNA/tRNA 2'-O-methyltransferase, partial [Candidatus Heimdallarchaeota archaeon]|nr:fibrillarin-like rRNA/tRNA 2'-O-methyltransferase [Candidatus Heimdallarchaeota archaeon]
NLTPGLTVYDEALITIQNTEYRTWNPYRSKLAAAIRNKIEAPLILPGQKVLYLGAASGTTVSHISDIIGPKGQIYAIEFAPRSIKDLLSVCQSRHKIIPILGDARQPATYAWQLETVDTIYQDVAQPDQASILIKNTEMFLRPNGKTIFAIKARSIDVTKDPQQVYQNEINQLKKADLKPQNPLELTPYVKDHVMVIATWLKK